MKKIIILILLLTVFTAVNVSALAIGGAFSINILDAAIPGGALSLKLDQLPLMWGIGFSIGGSGFNVGITGDWWLYHSPLFSIVSLYIGPGGYVKINSSNDNIAVDLGARIPVGLQIFPIKPLELFLEIAPSIGIDIGQSVTFPRWGLQGAVGFRFWF